MNEKRKINITFALIFNYLLIIKIISIMGIIRRGILGGFSGKVANVVGSSWKGISVMKSLPLSVANPRTTGQVQQRTKFGNTVAYATLILTSIIKPLWDRFAQRQSGYNAFISENIEMFSNELPALPFQLKTSLGKLKSTDVDSVSAPAGTDDVVVNWDTALDNNQLSDDEVYILAVNRTQGLPNLGTISGSVERSAGSATVQMPALIDMSDNIDVYLSFKRKDGTLVSNNTYATVAAS